jgi:hypothetical protein
MAVAQAPKTTQWRGFRALRPHLDRLENLAVAIGAFLATLHAEWRVISGPLVFNQDAEIHEFWMRRFQDHALFDDPLTNAFVSAGYQPVGFQSLYWLVSHVVDPVTFGEFLPLVLQPLSVWLVFRIVRSHTDWRPAAWLGAALFLVPWDILRFSGGHPRAFAQPIILLAVFFLLRRRSLGAAVVPALGVLFYPPAALAALAIVVLATLDWRGRPRLDTPRLKWAALGVAAFAVAAVVPGLFVGSSDQLISAAQARRHPEFGPQGQMHFFAHTTLGYLKHNYSGFFLRHSGSILAVAALLLLVLRPRNAKLLRWEIWCMPIAALGLYAAAQALLFHLYLPHRYTYPLLPFFCIVVAVTLRPTLEALAARARWAPLLAPLLSVAAFGIALMAFPLGPQYSARRFSSWLEQAAPYLVLGLLLGALGAAVWIWATSLGPLRGLAPAAAIVAGVVLVAGVAFAARGKGDGSGCRHAGLYAYLETLPKDAIIAGDPIDMNCVPIAARRPVVISQKMYQPWYVHYGQMVRERMFRTIRAYYGSSIAALVGLRTRYGADYLVVRTRVRTRAWRWPPMAPFSWELARLLRSGNIYAAHRLPETCETWRNPKYAVYSLACVAAERSQ